VVVESTSEVRLEHVMSKQKIDEWVPYNLLKGAMVLEARDRVIYDEWIGTVEEVSRAESGYFVADTTGFRGWHR